MIVYYNGVRLRYFDELTARLQANALLGRLQSDATQSRPDEGGAGVGGSAATHLPPLGNHGDTSCSSLKRGDL